MRLKYEPASEPLHISVKHLDGAVEDAERDADGARRRHVQRRQR